MNDDTALQKTKLTEHELDRLYIRWILGKNRSVSILSKDELMGLLSTGRLVQSDLSAEEKKLIEDKLTELPFKKDSLFSENSQILQLERSINSLTQQDAIQRRNVLSSSVEDQINLFMYGIKKATETILIDQMNYCSREEWAEKDGKAKTSLLKLFQYTFFEVNEQELRKSLKNIFTGEA